ncbi:hypothetical protein A3D84_05120 [Candidatus Woesebacteria bacterium RIFCSPHIGHO2_02_FULL_42_20]|uniref:Peptidase M50 domain-containing protein n=1 Tax=Candidatus Woesebacteria bacterium RIFCSPHIGHO2_12_FULL_41_24 TaxID=1802510 RepID=A0A1F8AUY0_9BACT|nr:MAG: hypothetical protein A2W15_00840 [Candidatus Woesebacteria bacterium RBG_16_41_13]OGM30835.1 MAG: hypothetical protein A2873_04405 [Candidatus Woesebacteria bacterium RIFCSPHIGHO2_01_FULL_42_80]OGM34401.1 MAG: hypothetical protein A3D84_05120 [Candidatus Woesebacteria bacterium RIFCSPHIGHO2_02_FULL_42_20]OGM55536.1 MAG: hypothetical protein A3E44_01280 [Candidatus Woesebacteria bacterium RIFCSPHIGHO2_12_FULL_41_24]OGM66200.1 MAG: hypothetical protein A2969_01445 [Candidatus Woesebacteri
MLDFLFTSPIIFFTWIAALLFAITIHEFSHAWTADRLGDPTPRLQGRITLNPIAHLDPLGTFMLIFFRFGWGKPVQFDPFNLKNPRRDAAVISLAGPAANLVAATALSLILRTMGAALPLIVTETFIPTFIILNVLLAIFNLIPIHPLDGGKILVGLLPAKDAHELDGFLHKYGIFILFLLIFPFAGTSPISSFLSPVMSFFLKILLPASATLV